MKKEETILPGVLPSLCILHPVAIDEKSTKQQRSGALVTRFEPHVTAVVTAVYNLTFFIFKKKNPTKQIPVNSALKDNYKLFRHRHFDTTTKSSTEAGNRKRDVSLECFHQNAGSTHNIRYLVSTGF